jgi:hypothetical protein
MSYPEKAQSLRRRGSEVKPATTIVQMLIRLTGLLLIIMGASFWIIKLLHLLVGLGAIGQAEGVGARIKEARTPAFGSR